MQNKVTSCRGNTTYRYLTYRVAELGYPVHSTRQANNESGRLNSRIKTAPWGALKMSPSVSMTVNPCTRVSLASLLVIVGDRDCNALTLETVLHGCPRYFGDRGRARLIGTGILADSDKQESAVKAPAGHGSVRRDGMIGKRESASRYIFTQHVLFTQSSEATIGGTA
jgi:hypothetical protein